MRAPGRLTHSHFLLRLLEFLLELLAVGFDFLLDGLFGPREPVVELFFETRLPDHDQGCLSAFQQVPEFLCRVARHALFQVTADATDDPSDYRRPDYGWREQDPNQCSDRDPSPRAVLRGLLVLIDMDLALGVLDDDRHIVGSDQLVRMEI